MRFSFEQPKDVPLKGPGDTPTPEVGDFPQTPEKDPEFERRKEEVLKLITRNGPTTEQQLEDWLEDTPAKQIRDILKKFEDGGAIERKIALDGTEYYILAGQTSLQKDK